MQRVIVFTTWAIFAILFQSVILPDFPSARVSTDLMFYLVIILGLRFGLTSGLLTAALLGYIVDAVSLVPFGTAIVSYALMFMIIRTVKGNIFIENRLALFFWVALFSLLKQFLETGFLRMRGVNLGLGLGVIENFLLESLWAAFLGLFIVPFMEKVIFKDWGLLFRRKRLKI